MDAIYVMPGQPHRLFVNVIHACPNACYFCVDFKGDSFYGFDLKGGRQVLTGDEIIAAAAQYPFRDSVREVYYCGIGEPLLRYDTVVETAIALRRLFPPKVVLAVNTSGTFYSKHPRLDFVEHFDLIQVSLNAESEEKYNAVCRPKMRGAFKTLMLFLHDLRALLDKSGRECRVELSVVDPTDVESLPESEHSRGDLPVPDMEACRRIAEGLGWPLKIKPLLRDYDSDAWKVLATRWRSLT